MNKNLLNAKGLVILKKLCLVLPVSRVYLKPYLPDSLSQPASICQNIDRKHNGKIIAFKTILNAYLNYSNCCICLRWEKSIKEMHTLNAKIIRKRLRLLTIEAATSKLAKQSLRILCQAKTTAFGAIGLNGGDVPMRRASKRISIVERPTPQHTVSARCWPFRIYHCFC